MFEFLESSWKPGIKTWPGNFEGPRLNRSISNLAPDCWREKTRSQLSDLDYDSVHREAVIAGPIARIHRIHLKTEQPVTRLWMRNVECGGGTP